MSVVLGLNAYHADSAACLVVDGRLVAAAEEERFRRIKHWAGFPEHAIAYCLEEAGLRAADIAHVALNSDRRAHLGRKAMQVLRTPPEPALVLDRLRNAGQRTSIGKKLDQAFPGQRVRPRVHAVEHHLAHLASAFHVAPFEQAAVVSVDGFGDFASAAWGTGRGRSITVDERVLFPHSLGVFYQALTQYLGFPHYGDEYKVMGLAPYGKPRFLPQLREVLRSLPDGGFVLGRSYFRHERERVPYRWDDGQPEVGPLFSPALEALLGPARQPDEPLEDRHRDIARSVQAKYEGAFLHLLRALHRRHGLDAVCIAGGCGMNSVANGKITRETPFRHVYVQAAAGDAGGAIGAALVVAEQIGDTPERGQMQHAYWGPAFGDAAIDAAIAARHGDLEAASTRQARIADEALLCDRVAARIAEGCVVGWFQGRMEWGPRALGNRSILADPRRADMRDLLNLKIKRRESFRPFAPSVLRETVAEWFEVDDDVPFMMKVVPIRADKRETVPAVTHVDGTGRLQTVTEASNRRYHRLISAFRARTGVPMLLNTSFNESEPIVCRPEEALDCFLRTNMDVLVLGDLLIERGA